MPFFGAHMSIAGGLARAIERIRSVDGEALQIFTRNQRQWQAPPLAAAEREAFAEAWRDWNRPHIASHGSYLVNLASPDPALAARSTAALAEELGRAEALGLPWHIIHPGAHLGQGPAQGIKACAARLDEGLTRSETTKVMLLLENTAGQGTTLGASLDELAGILAASKHAERLGVCFDTAHAHAAGYDLVTPEGYAATFARLEALIGLSRLRVFHVNDTAAPRGSRKDRHEHIGRGLIGLAGFSLLVNDPRFAGQPMILETHKAESLAEDRLNLAALRGLMRSGGRP